MFGVCSELLWGFILWGPLDDFACSESVRNSVFGVVRKVFGIRFWHSKKVKTRFYYKNAFLIIFYCLFNKHCITNYIFQNLRPLLFNLGLWRHIIDPALVLITLESCIVISYRRTDDWSVFIRASFFYVFLSQSMTTCRTYVK